MLESEECIGIEAWCSQLYAQQNYTGAKTCFYARRIPWHYISLLSPGCRRGRLWHERCQGTEAICMGTENVEQRAQCIARSRRPLWASKAWRSCPATTAFYDERCMGTDMWCEVQSTVKVIYPSVDDCRGLRDGVPLDSASLPRIEYLLPNHSAERPPFSRVYSERCGESGASDSSEACIGTEAWCQQHSVAKAWPSQEACKDFAAKTNATRSIWLYPSHDCNSGAESCIGTEAACLNNPFCCSDKDERCLGTDAWYLGYAQRGLNYTSRADCFAMRGLEPDSVINLLRGKVLVAGRDGRLRIAANLTTNALVLLIAQHIAFGSRRLLKEPFVKR
ncbi:hypothetical protein CDD81_3461 [Ophiocordyceps australis]|uniref:Uncharacterized protein n=1 Tax=Ophiocordyceps australis TaxID=1399860 RepID=A0A2C5YBR6_9HYPO|nr:hypothetical protein CDD81_3461 [Ophiocordyceps australis]